MMAQLNAPKRFVAQVVILCFTLSQVMPTGFAAMDSQVTAQDGSFQPAIDPQNVALDNAPAADPSINTHEGFYNNSPLIAADKTAAKKQIIDEEFYEGDLLKKKEDIRLKGKANGTQNVSLHSSRTFNVHGETVYAQVDIRDESEGLLLSELLIQTAYGFEGEGEDRQLKNIRGMVNDGRWLTIKLEGDKIDITYDRAPTDSKSVFTRVTDERITTKEGSRYTIHHKHQVTVEIFADNTGRIIDSEGKSTYYSDMMIVTGDLRGPSVDDDFIYVNGQYVPNAVSPYEVTGSRNLIFIDNPKAGSVSTGWSYSGYPSYNGAPAIYGNLMKGPRVFTPVLKSVIDNSMTKFFEMDLANHGKFVIEGYDNYNFGSFIGKILLPENAAGDLRVAKMVFIKDFSRCVGGRDGLPGVCTFVELVGRGSLSMQDTKDGFYVNHTFYDSLEIGHGQSFSVNSFEPRIEDLKMISESIWNNNRTVYDKDGLIVVDTLDTKGSVISKTITLKDAYYAGTGPGKVEFKITLTNADLEYYGGYNPKITSIEGTTDDGRRINIKFIEEGYVIYPIENKFIPLSEAVGIYIGEDVIKTIEQMMTPSFEIEGINLVPQKNGAKLTLDRVMLRLKAVQVGTTYLHGILWKPEPYEVSYRRNQKGSFDTIWNDSDRTPYQGKDYIRPFTVVKDREGERVPEWMGRGLAHSTKPFVETPFFGVGEPNYVVLGRSFLLDLTSVNRFSDDKSRTNQSWDFKLVPEGEMDELMARVSRQAQRWAKQPDGPPIAPEINSFIRTSDGLHSFYSGQVKFDPALHDVFFKAYSSAHLNLWDVNSYENITNQINADGSFRIEGYNGSNGAKLVIVNKGAFPDNKLPIYEEGLAFQYASHTTIEGPSPTPSPTSQLDAMIEELDILARNLENQAETTQTAYDDVAGFLNLTRTDAERNHFSDPRFNDLIAAIDHVFSILNGLPIAPSNADPTSQWDVDMPDAMEHMTTDDQMSPEVEAFADDQTENEFNLDSKGMDEENMIPGDDAMISNFDDDDDSYADMMNDESITSDVDKDMDFTSEADALVDDDTMTNSDDTDNDIMMDEYTMMDMINFVDDVVMEEAMMPSVDEYMDFTSEG